MPDWPEAILFVGSQGMLVATYGQHPGEYELYPRQKFAGFQPPPPTIPQSIGHTQEWFAACKAGKPALCNFDQAGPLTETVVLGAVAYRMGRKLKWDAENLRVTNCPEAAGLIQRANHVGWEVA